jgi:hypothetical protein
VTVNPEAVQTDTFVETIVAAGPELAATVSVNGAVFTGTFAGIDETATLCV